MLSDTTSHKEEILTNEYISYIRTSLGYLELFDDKSTSGSDPFDSIGFINNRLILIEFKNTISPSQIYYEGSRGSSIEKKIGTVLKLIYQKIDSRTYNCLKDKIKDTTIPEVWIIANSISERTKEKLDELLIDIAKKWQFNYKVSVWKKDLERVLIESNLQFKIQKDHSQISIPSFPNTATKRNPKLTYNTVQDILSKGSNLQIFEHLYQSLIALDLKPTYNITNMNFKKENIPGALIGIWPNKSNSNGLLVTYDINKLKIAFNPKINTIQSLGLTRNNIKVGNLGYNSFINSIDQCNHFIKKLNRST